MLQGCEFASILKSMDGQGKVTRHEQGNAALRRGVRAAYTTVAPKEGQTASKGRYYLAAAN